VALRSFSLPLSLSLPLSPLSIPLYPSRSLCPALFPSLPLLSLSSERRPQQGSWSCSSLTGIGLTLCSCFVNSHSLTDCCVTPTPSLW